MAEAVTLSAPQWWREAAARAGWCRRVAGAGGNQGRDSKRAPFRDPPSSHPFSAAARRFLASFSGIPEEVACTEACTPSLLLHLQRLMAHVLPQLLFVA
jgi:hypothetical protein